VKVAVVVTDEKIGRGQSLADAGATALRVTMAPKRSVRYENIGVPHKVSDGEEIAHIIDKPTIKESSQNL